MQSDHRTDTDGAEDAAAETTAHSEVRDSSDDAYTSAFASWAGWRAL